MGNVVSIVKYPIEESVASNLERRKYIGYCLLGVSPLKIFFHFFSVAAL